MKKIETADELLTALLANELYYFDDAHVVRSANRHKAKRLAAMYKSGVAFYTKPRTVKIGEREVVPPLTEVEEGQTIYYKFASSSGTVEDVFDIEYPAHTNGLKNNELFATEEDCQAWHDAINALVMGEK
ncbi:MAG: hypothetical protein KDC99_18825 [Cyclobacteriaceae bacterium]|nr:hypothetical protein [Cyclobacteriaceae bacterium]